jgi:hypothetical protein
MIDAPAESYEGCTHHTDATLHSQWEVMEIAAAQ